MSTLFAILSQHFLKDTSTGKFHDAQFHLLIIFANSLVLGKARQNVGPVLDPDCFDIDGIPGIAFFKALKI